VVSFSALFLFYSKRRVLFCTGEGKKVSRFTDQAALDALGGISAHFSGGWQAEWQTAWEAGGRCSEAGSGGLTRLNPEVQGEQSGEQGKAVLAAGLQGLGNGKGVDAVLSCMPKPRCTSGIVFTHSSVPGNERLL